MNKTLIYPLAMIAALFLGPVSNYAQDIFDGLFEKEQPRFFAQVNPTSVPGEVEMVFHFTHSKASEVEASVWLTDLGGNLQDPQSKEMVSGLRTLGNRKRDTLVISGLTPRHFYNIGVDYRVKSAIPRKFESAVVREHFRYEGSLSQPVAQQQPQTQRTAPANPDWQARSVQPMQQSAAQNSNTPAQQPCKEPQLNLRVDPAGYCDRLNRPAVIVSCSNCQGTTWDFLVEVKTSNGKWFPTRADGRPQAALGVAPRTEPLCLIPDNNYQLRVLAWGENCNLPVVKELGTTIQVGNSVAQQPLAQSYGAPTSSPYRTQPAAPVNAPEVCGVSGTATLMGKTIRGSLQLPANSDCSALNPYAEVAYVHPGYRDINMGKVSLYPGLDMPFELDLDQRDLQRGIHTLRVTVYMPLPDLPRPVAAETFWIRAEEQAATANRSSVIPDLENRLQNAPNAYGSTPESYSQTPDAPMRGTIGTKGIERTDDDLYIDEALLEEQANTISVTATDPNCTPIQDLQLVYSPTQPDRPLYLSWLSPRCCQEEGCKYTVWAGPTPEKLSLVVTGQKAGAQVSEILNNLPARHNYFEVAVETTNGVRKAAYVPGSGPIYGIEAVLDYHDQFKPQKSDPIQGQMSSDTQRKGGVNGGLSDRMSPPALPVAMESNPLQPKLPISKFRPCKYQRETTVTADYPIQAGETVTIDYAFTEPDHQFTLYHQPFGSTEWQLAPGTTELQSKPSFELQATDYHAGKYLVLVYKDTKNWGCLSAPLSDPIELNVVR
ncbi:hypothetical protein [Phaeodactylibacter xiamenensis]|uniref:hypothetical protein n=2 Tax=Phaeodactylibacter xiamenensis TaxID=1524460 RepID=UPI003BAB6CCE